ncbi:MAG: hypothetical protein V1770_01950, partial [bacterium]
SDPPSPNDDPHCLCKYGKANCLQDKGWKNGTRDDDYIDPEWVPYALMRTDSDLDDTKAWVLIYNGTEYKDNDQQLELRRIWRASDDYANGVTGYVTAPMTRIKHLSTDSWSAPSTTVIFVGPDIDSVMEHLGHYTNWKWPRLTTSYSISGTVN